MAFWDKWFAPTCDGCGEKIVGTAIAEGEQELCASCHAAIVEGRRAEVEARRLAEEEARRRFEEGKVFGTDPRTRS